MPTAAVKTNPAQLSGQDRYEAVVAANSDSFDNHTRDYSFTYDKVWAAVSQLFREQKEQILVSNKDTGILETKVTQRGVFGFPYYEKLYISIARIEDASTKVSFKLCRFYQVDDYAKGVGQLYPYAKDKVNPKAEAFLDKINKRLQTGK